MILQANISSGRSIKWAQQTYPQVPLPNTFSMSISYLSTFSVNLAYVLILFLCFASLFSFFFLILSINMRWFALFSIFDSYSVGGIDFYFFKLGLLSLLLFPSFFLILDGLLLLFFSLLSIQIYTQQLTYYNSSQLIRIKIYSFRILIINAICHTDDIIKSYFIMSFHKHEVTLPFIKPENVERVTPFSYIWRDGGIRIQQENINQKLIFHNYGQGLAEFSLAYGSAYIASKMITLKKQSTKTKDVAVIGSGIAALMTTLELLKRGHRVNLYVDKLPIRTMNGQKQIKPAAGLQFWYNGDYDNCDPLKHELISKLSYDFLKDSLKSNRYQSLSWANVYATGSKAQEIKDSVTDFITNQIHDVHVHFGNQKLQQFTCFRTIMIDTQLFSEEVFIELKLRNINISQRSFKSLHDILSLKQEFVYNCLKGENKQIFGDHSILEIPSYYISLNQLKVPKQSFAVWKSSQVQQQQDFVLSMTNRKIQLTTRNKNLQNKNIDNLKQKLLTKAYHFLKERTLKPYKL